MLLLKSANFFQSLGLEFYMACEEIEGGDAVSS